MENKQPESVQCAFCRKVFVAGCDMACGANVPTHMAAGSDGAWCKTDDIVEMLRNARLTGRP